MLEIRMRNEEEENKNQRILPRFYWAGKLRKRCLWQWVGKGGIKYLGRGDMMTLRENVWSWRCWARHSDGKTVGVAGQRRQGEVAGTVMAGLVPPRDEQMLTVNELLQEVVRGTKGERLKEDPRRTLIFRKAG